MNTPVPIESKDRVLPASVTRTVVPYVVAYLSTLALRRWAITIDSDVVTPLVTLVIGSIYYFVVRLIERVRPKFGWLLGWAAQPTTYSPPASFHALKARGDV